MKNIKKYSGVVDYSGIDLQYANEMNRAFMEVFDAYDTKYPLGNIKPYNTREKRFKDKTSEASYEWGNRNLWYNKAYYKSEKAFSAHKREVVKLIDTVMSQLDDTIKAYRNDASVAGKYNLKYLQGLKKSGRTNVPLPDAYGSTIHEMGHYLDDELFMAEIKKSGFDLCVSYEKFSASISAYATKDEREYVAESFAAYWMGEMDIVDPLLVKIWEGVKRNAK